MPRTPIVGGNWKCNPDSKSKLDALIDNINKCDTSACEVYVCPSPLHVDCAPRILAPRPFSPCITRRAAHGGEGQSCSRASAGLAGVAARCLGPACLDAGVGARCGEAAMCC